jgi:hypothetical protein
LQTFTKRISSNLAKDIIQVSNYYLMMVGPPSKDPKIGVEPADRKVYGKDRKIFAYTDMLMAMLYGKNSEFAPKDKTIVFSKIVGTELMKLMEKNRQKILEVVINQTSEEDFDRFHLTLSDVEEISRFSHQKKTQ